MGGSVASKNNPTEKETQLQEYRGNEYLKRGKIEEVVKRCEQLAQQFKNSVKSQQAK